MSDDSKAAKQARRLERLQDALRQNLHRRKAQARARAAREPTGTEPNEDVPDGAGEGRRNAD